MRVRYTVASRERRKNILKRAKGFKASRGYHLRVAKEALLHALTFEYRDRRNKKRDIRRLWITRINAFVKAQGMTYSQFIGGLTRAKVVINRKMLANLAIVDAEAMNKIVELARQSRG